MYLKTVLDLLAWSPWQPLFGSWFAGQLPDRAGLYRIRRAGCEDQDYIGQTGAGRMTLPQRAGMLRGVYAEKMPYRDPHTAGPALWALRHATGADFEISVVPLEGTTPWRKGIECVAIALYRQKHGCSPTVNWGRMPACYRLSSSNNVRLVAAGKRIRGGPADAEYESHLPGILPVDGLEGNPQATDWCGHAWSQWQPIAAVLALIRAGGNGLYRMRRSGEERGLLYIGQGHVQVRLATHARKTLSHDHPQGEVFAGAIECSWVLNEAWYSHQRLELENDLIAAHVLTTGEIPLGQFIGYQRFLQTQR